MNDGLSCTVMAGEKHVAMGHFGVGWLDSSIYNGNYTPPTCRAAGPNAPLVTSLSYDVYGESWLFGSYHPGVCQFVFCDGSVHALPATINLAVLGNLSCRTARQGLASHSLPCTT